MQTTDDTPSTLLCTVQCTRYTCSFMHTTDTSFSLHCFSTLHCTDIVHYNLLQCILALCIHSELDRTNFLHVLKFFKHTLVEDTDLKLGDDLQVGPLKTGVLDLQ